MNRTRWAALLGVACAGLIAISFVYPAAETGGMWTPTASPMASPSPLAMATQTPSPTVTATPTVPPTATPTLEPTLTATATISPTPWPFDTRADLPRYIYIDQATQHMFVFEHGILVRDIPCSTGLPGDNTFTEAWSGEVGEYWGTFFAYGVYADEAWHLFKSQGNILIHSLPYTITETTGDRIYYDRDALGVRPASHGCIRISPEDARWFTQWGPEGVPITVSDPYRDKWLSLLSEP